jgi:tRNA-uridine 2-sulfurtransferase
MINIHPNKKTVVVGMSGGVDSSVSAYLLKKEGFNVIGLFMKNWEEPDNGEPCSSVEDFEDVIKICKQLDIPHYTVNFVKEYKEKVFKEFVKGYEKGLTPNPDILCNKEIKFKHFFNKAKEIGADFLATGHYAKIVLDEEKHCLHKGLDKSKDQSYFLYTLKSSILKEVLFPLGSLLKSEVRQIAREQNLTVSEKKDSTGICFIGERKFTPFLQRYIKNNPGEFRSLSGKVLGTHQGISYYTIGQRKGIGLGGEGAPWYVVDKDVPNNVVYVERGLHPSLFSDELIAEDLTWIDETYDFSLDLQLEVKIRYRQESQKACLSKNSDGTATVTFESPQRAIAPMQSIVFYQGENCLGGGIIKSKSPSYYHLNKALPLKLVD